MRDDARTRLASLGMVLVALVLVLLVLSPVLLFGTRLSGADLLLLAAGVFGIGLLGRWRGSGAVRQLGSVLASSSGPWPWSASSCCSGCWCRVSVARCNAQAEAAGQPHVAPGSGPVRLTDGGAAGRPGLLHGLGYGTVTIVLTPGAGGDAATL